MQTDPRFANLDQVLSTGLNPLTPITTPYEPFWDPVNQTFPTVGFTGLANNNAEAAFDPNFHTPYSETFTLGIQRELPGNFMLEAS